MPAGAAASRWRRGVLPVGTVTTPAFLETTLALAHPRLEPAVADGFRAPYRTADRRAGIGGFVADIPATADHPSRPELDRIAAGVRGLDVPALLLWGPRDPVFSARYLRDLRERLPHADVHRFEGAGHLVVEDEDVAGACCAGSTRATGAPRRRPTPRRRAVPRPRRDARRAGRRRRHRRSSSWPGATVAPRRRWRGARGPDRPAGPRPRGERRRGRATGSRCSCRPVSTSPSVLYACLRLGAVVVVADAGLGVQGLTRAVRAAEPDASSSASSGRWSRRGGCAGRRRWSAPDRCAPGVRRAPWASSASLDELAALGRASTDDLPWPDPDADAAVLFTSGSTGPAKGVVYTHRRLAAMRDVGRPAPTASARTARSSPRSRRSSCSAPRSARRARARTWTSPSPGTLTAPALARGRPRGRRRGRLRVTGRAAVGGPRRPTASETGRRSRGVRLFLSAGAPVGVELLEAAGDAHARAPRRTRRTA